MTLWIGDYKGHTSIRCLGLNGVPSSCLRLLKPCDAVSTVLRHNEGTTRTGGTSPSIGAGESKRCGDCGVLGFNVGSTVGDPDKEPMELNDGNCCEGMRKSRLLSLFSAAGVVRPWQHVDVNAYGEVT